MNELLDIRFQLCGHWENQNGTLACELLKYTTQRNMLYASIPDGEAMFVGKALQPLAGRMSGYRNPAPSQTANGHVLAQFHSIHRGVSP